MTSLPPTQTARVNITQQWFYLRHPDIPDRPSMKIMGIDFTSRPTRKKPLTCMHCSLDGPLLLSGHLEEWPAFESFEAALAKPGPWIAGIDFPFGQSRTFVENVGWPCSWKGYVEHAGSLGRDGYRKTLDAYRAQRPLGDKEHRRATDIVAGSISPQKLYGVPVGLMFFEGAPRLIRSGVTIPLLRPGDPLRIAVEAYPGVLARHFIGRTAYKSDARSKQTEEQFRARHALLDQILDDGFEDRYGFRVQASRSLADDPSGDQIDALLCAIQAAWAWTKRNDGYGLPPNADSLEGWIADPTLR